MYLNYVLLLLYIGHTVQGMSIDEAFQVAGCLARCKEKSCENGCYKINYSQNMIRIPVASNFNATLHCKDVNFLSISHNPGIFVIEQSKNDNNIVWSDTIVTIGKRSSFLNLSPGAQYRYRGYRVTEEGISDAEISDWFTTSNINDPPQQIKNIYIKNITREQSTHNYVQAEVIFEPAEDRSCFYDVLSWTQDDGLSHKHINVTQDFKFYLYDLDYERNHTVIISAKNHGTFNSSQNVTLSFMTPSCLDIHKNLSICPPDLVQGLRITNISDMGDKYNFTITWNKSKHLPDNYTIQILPFDGSGVPYLKTVSGELTEVQCSIVKNDLLYVISIISESPGGTNGPISIFKTFREDNVSTISIVTIIFPLIALAIAIITIFYLFYCNRIKKLQSMKKNTDQQKNHDNLKNSITRNPTYEKFLKSQSVNYENNIENDPLITKDSFEINLTQLTIKDVLGSGISGIVRLGSLKDDRNKSIQVAVKMPRDYPTIEEIRNFQQEIVIMKSAGIHTNIVSLIGCCTSHKIPMLVVEYCSRGDLQTYLRSILREILNNFNSETDQIAKDNPNYLTTYNWNRESVSNKVYDLHEDVLQRAEQITAKDLLCFARQVANGMEFLSLNRIVHRDLAARNVLVCEDMTVKISDFGLSRDVYRESVYKKESNGSLPIKWMAIEALTHQIYTTQSDVWSFGILLWEIVTLGCNPYPEIPTNMILPYLKAGNRMEKPSNCGSQLYEIMNACWRTSPRSRPSFTKLKYAIDRLLMSVTQHEYINLQDDVFQVPQTPEIIE